MKRDVSVETPTTRSEGSRQWESIYAQVEVVGAAPVTLASSLSRVAHRPGCGGAAVASASESHSVRAFCECMSAFEIDKQVLLELLARELAVDAFFCLLPLLDKYGPERVIADPETLLVIVRYDFLSRFYASMCDRMEGDHDYRARPFLPLLEPVSYYQQTTSRRNKGKIPRLKEHVSERSWLQICAAAKTKGCQLHYFRSFASSFENIPFTQVLNLPNFLFAGFKVSARDPSRALIRLDCYLDCPLDAILTVMSETDLTKLWVPYFRFPMRVGLESADKIAQLGRFNKATLYRIALPWPFNDVEVILHGWLADDLNVNNRIVLCFNGVDPDYPVATSLTGVEGPPLANKSNRVYVEGGCRVRVESSDRIKLELLWNIDLKMSVPQTLVRFVARTFVRAGINALRGVCQAAISDPQWVERRARDPWLYRYVAQRLQELETRSLQPKPSYRASPASSPKRKRDYFRRTKVA
eukprot:Protomagalhaensia_sp_Gyna_25__6096@NODE_981_length_2333_cov_32_083261_g781_i0_p1_GENE_NODE_981_length_2333_cov_32_083261_g781_i0NODE_981_length_2333_cov_32_083261_g781_i0_p1_ORF_typecomplete_len470_score56_14START/PF01852_19/1_2e05LZ_Tnp_IS481/PF13011_6/0_21_NODE_981_length_2333_cov_32_083261_g781_i03111720